MKLTCDCFPGCWGVQAKEQGWSLFVNDPKLRKLLAETAGTHGYYVITDDGVAIDPDMVPTIRRECMRCTFSFQICGKTTFFSAEDSMQAQRFVGALRELANDLNIGNFEADTQPVLVRAGFDIFPMIHKNVGKNTTEQDDHIVAPTLSQVLEHAESVAHGSEIDQYKKAVVDWFRAADRRFADTTRITVSFPNRKIALEIEHWLKISGWDTFSVQEGPSPYFIYVQPKVKDFRG